MNLKDLINASKNLKKVEVAGMEAYIKPISAKDALTNLTWLQEVDDEKKATPATSLEYMCRVVASTLCDEKGKLLTSPDKWEELQELEENALTYLFDVAKNTEVGVKKD